MTEPIGSFEDAVAFALTLPGTELSTSYGKPAVKVNGRAFLFPSHEADTSFGIAMDLDTIEILKETDPATFWQTPHYVGWEGVLIRYDSPDPERVRAMIERARDCDGDALVPLALRARPVDRSEATELGNHAFFRGLRGLGGGLAAVQSRERSIIVRTRSGSALL